MAEQSLHDEIEAVRARESPDAAELATFREYASGDHGRVLTTAQKKMLGSSAAHPVADNILRLVLTTAASRLELEGWEVPSNQAVQDWLDMFYLTSRIARLQFDTHFATLRDGMGAVSLRWKSNPDGTGRVTAHRESWWDGNYGMFVAFDEYDEPAWAVKDFVVYEGQRPIDRRTVYYPDRISRYRREGRGWRQHPIPGDPDESGVVPWVKRDGSPIGLPVISFANSLADEGNYGRSDLYGLLGLQDSLNSIQYDLTAAAKYTGFPMYYGTGMTVEDAKGKVGPGMFLSSKDAASRIGAIPPGDMSSLIAAHTYKRQTIGVITSTPMHLITGGEWPSGEALIRAEMPLVDKVRKLARVNGPSWVMLAHRATEIANTWGRDALDEDASISARFAPPERLDELTVVQVQQAREQLYRELESFSDPTLLGKTGLLSEDEITAIIAAKQDREDRFLTPVGEF